MIVKLYALFLALSIFFVCLGYALRGNADIFKYVGFGFLFLLGILVIPSVPGSVEYQSGEVQVFNNATNTTTITNSYSEYTDFTIGFYIALLGVFGFINTLIETKQGGFD